MPPKAPVDLEPTALFPFDFQSDVKDNGFMVVFGTRGRGKTTLTRIFTQLMPWSFTAQFVFFVGTEQVKEYWTAVSHPFYVRDPEPKAFEELLQIQREKVQICKLYNIPFPPEWELVIVVDDCGSFPWFLRNDVLKVIASNGRNEHITFVALIQEWTQLEPTSRKNATTFIGMRTEQFDTVKDIHKNYASSMNKDRFRTVYSLATNSNKALCINCGADDPNDLLGYTHARMLHPDGHEAIANQREAMLINEQRVKKGKEERTWDVHNMLKRLGAEIHQQIANKEYRAPSLQQLVKSNSLLKMMNRNSLPKSMPDAKPQRKRATSKNRSPTEPVRRPSLLEVVQESMRDGCKKSTKDEVKEFEESSDYGETSDDDEDEFEIGVGNVDNARSGVHFQTREQRKRTETKKTSKKK